MVFQGLVWDGIGEFGEFGEIGAIGAISGILKELGAVMGWIMK